MIERYTLPHMGRLWAPETRFKYLLEVEQAVALVQGRMKIIPKKAADKIQTVKKVNAARVFEIEKTTKHDIIAFVSQVAEQLGEEGRYVHYGLTSSDVLDTALSLQIRESFNLLDKQFDAFDKALVSLVKKNQNVLCAGRTHGMHAEPTTFGLKMAGFLVEFRRNRERVRRACEQACVVKLSGAVGTYSALDLQVEEKVAKELILPTESVATQVVPRDRHAEVFLSLALLAAGYERLAIEIRHLQRTEVGEAEEPFSQGQKGSSAMPHKRNPISSENITGLSRLLRSNAFAALENVALWHERDISHSSVERVIFPDSFILADYATNRLTQVVKGLVVKKDRMLQNLELTQGQIFSSHVLLKIIQAGFTREEAYAIVQKHSHSLKKGDRLDRSLLKDNELKGKLKSQDLKNIFSGQSHKKNIQKIIERALK